MDKKIAVMINMAMAIAKINNADVEKLCLEKTHMGPGGEFDFYSLYVKYSDGKEITIRQDCTIVG